MTLNLDTSARSCSGELFERTVPRDLVHRLAVSEVLITGFRRTGTRRCIAASQWPRLHVFYGNPAGMVDSALVAETLRQAAIGAAHRVAGVPLGDFMLIPGMTIHIRPGYRRSPDYPTCVKVALEFTSLGRSRTGAVASFEVAATFSADGVEFATGTTGARVVPAATYQRMRSNARPASARQPGEILSCEQVGQPFDCSVTIGPEDRYGRWPLRPEPGSPTLYDHGLDHIPGMIQVEAVRQSLRAKTSSPALDFASFDASFLKFIEPGQESFVVLTGFTMAAPEEGTATAEIRSGGEVSMKCVVWFKTGGSGPAPAATAGLSSTVPEGRCAVAA